jgi:protein TonB
MERSTFVQDDDNKVFVKVEVEPSFPGGEREWRRYLERNLDAGLPLKNGCKSGSYTVMIRFIVDRAGNISDVRPLTKFGYGMEDQVMSLIKKARNGYREFKMEEMLKLIKPNL